LTDELQTIKLSGKIEIDEALFGGRRRGGKPRWGSIEHKNLILVSIREMELSLHFRYRTDSTKH